MKKSNILHRTDIGSAVLWSLLVLVSSSGLSLELHAQTLGRLFTTTQQRAQIDNFKNKHNKDDKIETIIFTAPAIPIKPKLTPKPLMYNGIVKRSDGSTTVWVNGESVDSASNKKYQRKNKLHHKITNDNSVIIKPVGSKTTVKLKPGQVWRPQTRKVTDRYQLSTVSKNPSVTNSTTNAAPDTNP